MYKVTFKKDGMVKNYFFTQLSDVFSWLAKNTAVVEDGYAKIKFVEDDE